jgi:hypothetical protein
MTQSAEFIHRYLPGRHPGGTFCCCFTEPAATKTT